MPEGKSRLNQTVVLSANIAKLHTTSTRLLISHLKRIVTRMVSLITPPLMALSYKDCPIQAYTEALLLLNVGMKEKV